jgi:hypothetical protein
MNTHNYEQLIVSGIKGLPQEMLREVADFVYFMRRRAVDPESFEEEQYRVLLEEDLSNLSENETKHLEEAFADYEQLYPGKLICYGYCRACFVSRKTATRFLRNRLLSFC